MEGNKDTSSVGVEDNVAAAAPSSSSPPRASLVELAVKFLNNPRVWERPMEDKKAFLRKKGDDGYALCNGLI